VLLAGCAVLLAGCAEGDLPQNVLAPEGPIARTEDNLWNLVFPIAIAVFILVQGLLAYALVRFRARSTDSPSAIPKQTAGNTRLEVMWTVVPALILAGIAVPTVRTIFELTARPADPLEVRVVGKQYWWEFEYTGDTEQGLVTANELTIPVDRPIYLTMEGTGQQDADPLGVIHSFWVPKLAGKQDVVPGHQRTMTIEAEEPGEYSGQCAEFCGLSHANMRFKVIALEQADYDAWVADRLLPADPPADELAARGAELFTDRTCIACHAINGYEGAEARVGPDLTHFAAREKFAGYILDNDVEEGAENVSAWLENPQVVKPGSQMPNLQLSPEDIEALVAYLATLK
jgi:cytochrome c oxidase subunit 2